MHLIVQHWPWVVIAVTVLISGYLALRANVNQYRERVKRNLEQYTGTSQTTAVSQLSIPDRNVSDSETLAMRKLHLWQGINKHPMETYPQIEWLVHQLAEAKIDYDFLETYMRILGTHYRFLAELNLRPNGANDRAGCSKFLAEQSVADPRVGKYVLDDWLRLLADRGLIVSNLDAVNLTKKGQDFLVWLLRHQLPIKSFEAD